MIRIESKLLAIDSVTMEPIYPQFAGITEDELRAYIKEHPMPEDPNYSPEDLIMDLTRSEGIYILPFNVKEETIDYVQELLNTLIRCSEISTKSGEINPC